MRFCRRHDKYGVRRRFLKRLEERIESADGQHMNFVDDVDFESRLQRRKSDLIRQTPHMVDAVVRGGIDFTDIHKGAVIRSEADFAFIARIAAFGVQTIDRLRKDLGK